MEKGIRFSDLLLTAFIVLKLIGEIDWSWIWVLSPFWGSIVFTVIVGLLKKDKEDKPGKKSLWAERMEEMKNKKL